VAENVRWPSQDLFDSLYSVGCPPSRLMEAAGTLIAGQDPQHGFVIAKCGKLNLRPRQ